MIPEAMEPAMPRAVTKSSLFNFSAVAIAAAEARRKFAERFAEASPAGLGEKGEARPLTEWRAAFAAVSEEVAAADTAIRDAQRKQREIDREIARLESDRSAKPPSKLNLNELANMSIAPLPKPADKKPGG